MSMSTEGLVEHQKRNQTATFQLVVGFVFVVELAYRYRLEVPPSKGVVFYFFPGKDTEPLTH